MTREMDYNEIKANFRKFADGWASGEVDLLDDAVMPDVKAYFSIFGPERAMARSALKENLAIRTHTTTYGNIDVNNYVCLIEGDHAQQIAYLNGIFSDDTDGNYEHYCWSGQMANHWVKTSKGWRMNEMRFDLNLDDYQMLGRRDDDLSFIINKGPGNIEFVSNWLGIIDKAGWFKGTRLPTICPELDAPWYVIKNPENIGTDEEQLAELFYKYCFAIDTDCFLLFTETFSPYVTASIFWGTQDFRQLLQTLKLNRAGSRRCQHMGRFGKCTVNGDHAYYEVNSKNPITFMHPNLTKADEAEAGDWSSFRWLCTAKKENGVWRIVKFYSAGGEFKESELYN